MLKKITLGFSFCLFTGIAFGQTCKLSSIKKATPDARFTSQLNGTVLDTKTQLVWKRCSEGQTWDDSTCVGSASTHTWQGALNVAQASSFAGQNDWRLPNKKEFKSIVEFGCYSPAINLTVFPNTSPVVAWSSSPYANSSDYAWYVDFYFGNDYASLKSLSNRVRLVRNEQ